jgi:hypothetical protein
MFNKNKFLKYFIILIAIIIVLFAILYRPTKFTLTEEYIKNNTVIVNSTKNKEYIENITYIGLNVLELDSITVNIFDIPTIIKVNNYLNGHTIKGLIVKNFNNNYTIFIDYNETSNNLFLILSHELIHLEQYQNNRLELLFGGAIMRYEGKLYIVKDIKYNERPWEIEAFNKEQDLKYKISVILY